MEIGFVFLKFMVYFPKWLSVPFRKLIALVKRKQTVPEIDEPLLLYSATKLAEMIRKKELKSEIIVKVYIQRIKAVNHIINAVVEDRFTEALQEAKDIDIFLSQTQLSTAELASQKPLLGVPLTIKESCSVKGLSLVVGSTFMEGTKAKEDGVAVGRLREAGAIPLLASTTSELCLSVDCDNLVTGTTRNPYDSNRTSGGSSGGEGALIGSGSSIAGIGSDLAGSVRIPAMFCGIFGHKPTSRLVPCDGHWPTCSDPRFHDYITIGALTRYAEDLKLLIKALSATDKIDFDAEVNLSDTKVYFLEDLGFRIGASSVQGEIKHAVRSAVSYLKESQGVRVCEEKFDLGGVGESSFFAIIDLEDKVKVLKDPKRPDGEYSFTLQILKHVFRCRPDVTLLNAITDVAVHNWNVLLRKSNAQMHYARLKAFREKFMDALGSKGVLIMPTYPTSAFQPGEVLWQLPNLPLFTLVFNVLGFPSTQVPMGFDKSGLPIGIQVISAPYCDNLCIAVAEALEKRFGGWRPPSERIR